MVRRLHRALAVFSVVALGACGSGSSGQAVAEPTIAAALTYKLAGFAPTAPVVAGTPTRIAFQILLPSGHPLTRFRTGAGPNVGVDLVIARNDDSHILYTDTDITRDGHISQPVVFPAPGRYRIAVIAYPDPTQTELPPSVLLFTWITVAVAESREPVPPPHTSVTTDGYRFRLAPAGTPHAVQAAALEVTVRDPTGKPAHFTLWDGALAHAIFIRSGTLDYFHTHVCPPGANPCSASVGASVLTGASTAPGVLHIGVLFPTAGTWRMFLFTGTGGRPILAAFTLTVTP